MSKPRSNSKRRPPSNKPLFKHKQWQQCYESWLRSIQERSGSTTSITTYRNMTRRFFCNPARTPNNYTRADVESFVRGPAIRQRTPTPPSAPTQNQRLAILRSFYAYAAQYDVPFRNAVRPILHNPNPTRGMRDIKPGRRRRDLSAEELKQLFAAIPRDSIKGKRDYALFSFYLWTARRCSEIARLTWGDIQVAQFVESSGNTVEGHTYRYSPKGHSRETFTAELRPEAWEALHEYLVASGRLETIQPSDPLFVRVDNARGRGDARPMWAASIDRILAQYRRLSGLDVEASRQICVHSLRHTRARMQYRTRHDIMEIKTLLGHADIGTTQIYLVDVEPQRDTGAEILSRELGKL